jgi:hypothetical protein
LRERRLSTKHSHGRRRAGKEEDEKWLDGPNAVDSGEEGRRQGENFGADLMGDLGHIAADYVEVVRTVAGRQACEEVKAGTFVSNAIIYDMLDRLILVGAERAERRGGQRSFEERGIEVGAVEPETTPQNRNRAWIRKDVGARRSRRFEGVVEPAERAAMEELELARQTADSGAG